MQLDYTRWKNKCKKQASYIHFDIWQLQNGAKINPARTAPLLNRFQKSIQLILFDFNIKKNSFLIFIYKKNYTDFKLRIY